MPRRADVGGVDLVLIRAPRSPVLRQHEVDARLHLLAGARVAGVGGDRDEAVAGPVGQHRRVDGRVGVRAVAPHDDRVAKPAFTQRVRTEGRALRAFGDARRRKGSGRREVGDGRKTRPTNPADTTATTDATACTRNATPSGSATAFLRIRTGNRDQNHRQDRAVDALHVCLPVWSTARAAVDPKSTTRRPPVKGVSWPPRGRLAVAEAATPTPVAGPYLPASQHIFAPVTRHRRAAPL